MKSSTFGKFLMEDGWGAWVPVSIARNRDPAQRDLSEPKVGAARLEGPKGSKKISL